MPFNISSFKSQGPIFGGARPSLFSVTMTPPAGGGALNPAGMNQLRFMCKAASLPEAQVSSIEIGYFGRKIKVAGERAFQDWQITVINDEDFAIRSMLESWSNGINTLESNIREDRKSTRLNSSHT